MSEDIPQVSVVIPAYNQGTYLTGAVQSVLAQTYRHFEIIVVDDGSTDNTSLVAQEFGDAIHYIRQENQGLAAARNTAIRNARAEIIALLDSDDLWEAEFLEKMINHLSRNPQAAAVYCGFQYIDAQGQSVGQPSLKIVSPELFYKTLICEGNWLVPISVIFRKKLAEDAGLFDESLRASEDADLWAKLSTQYPFVGVPEVLVNYRRHESNMTRDPERMVTANYQRTEKMFGPPDGDISTWSELKRCAYTRLFRYGTSRYLAYGDVVKSVDHFQRFIEIAPNKASTMEVWRDLARVHLPDEYRSNPADQFDWEQAQTDVMSFLKELGTRVTTSTLGQRQYCAIKGHACVALAEEAWRDDNLNQTFVWLWRAAKNYPILFFSRTYWGTMARGLTNMFTGR